MKQMENANISDHVNLEKEQGLFKSKHLRKAFENINVTTSPEAVVELLDDKKKMLIEVLKSKQLPVELLKKNPAVYISSGTDIEYPLCLGARQIIMVDPILSDEAKQAEIKNRIQALIEKGPIQFSKDGASFDFNFGEGDEIVSVKFESKIYDKTNIHHSLEGDEYILGENNAMVLSYRPNNIMIKDDKVRDNLVKGGVLLVDDQTMSSHEYFEARDKVSSGSSQLSNSEVLSKVYKERGYEYIPLTTSNKGWHKTFLKKI